MCAAEGIYMYLCRVCYVLGIIIVNTVYKHIQKTISATNEAARHARGRTRSMMNIMYKYKYNNNIVK